MMRARNGVRSAAMWATWYASDNSAQWRSSRSPAECEQVTAGLAKLRADLEATRAALTPRREDDWLLARIEKASRQPEIAATASRIEAILARRPFSGKGYGSYLDLYDERVADADEDDS